jgi:two-component system, chemotaxis family, protein-glutamate methylesterase/glutaminase
MPLPVSKPAPAGASRKPVRVCVVDDSAVVRGFIVRILESEPGIDIVATCSNGQAAVMQAGRCMADVIVLDIEMPIMDGLAALPKILAADPGVQVLMASTLTQRNADVTLKALARGAADYIPKPAANRLGANEEFRRQLIEKVCALGARRSKLAEPRSREATPPPFGTPAEIKLRTVATVVPELLVIGSSTGGPQALTALLRALPPSVDAPILIAQHMPPTFTGILAQHLTQACGRACSEAKEGEPLRRSTVLIAPGDFHLEVGYQGPRAVAHLTKAAPENFCRPSLNPLLRSAVRAFGAQAAAVVLTGMGSDGFDGARDVAAAGGALVAQDEATSVVWGMPGAVAKAGLCSAVLPLSQIAQHLARLFAETA